MLCCMVFSKPTLNQYGLATWATQQNLSPFRLCLQSFNLPGSVVHPGVPQRSFVRLPDADWPDRGRCCFQLLPQLNCEPVPVRVFFGVVNFRAMHSNVITRFESAWVHCGFLVIQLLVSKRAQNQHGSVQLFLKFKIMLAWRHSKLPRYRYQKYYATGGFCVSLELKRGELDLLVTLGFPVCSSGLSFHCSPYCFS